jgi:DNA end-binding protein Ku
LIESWTDKHFDFSHYVDRYEEDVRKLIEAKVHGRDIVVPEVEEEPAVYNLMDALRKSMAQRRHGSTASARSSDGRPSDGRRHPSAGRRKRRSAPRRHAS